MTTRGNNRKQARGSTPLVPSAFLNDHRSDDDSSPLLPLGAAESRTISNASIFEENYFFEWCVWFGYAVYGLAFGWYGLIAIVGQAIIVGSIFGVTGIPPTEAQGGAQQRRPLSGLPEARESLHSDAAPPEVAASALSLAGVI